MTKRPTVKVFNIRTKRETEHNYLEFIEIYEGLKEQEKDVFRNRAKVSNVVTLNNITYTFDEICYTSFRRSYKVAVA